MTEIAAHTIGAGLDAETRKMVLDSIRDYAKKKLSHPVLIELDARNEFPHDIMRDLLDPDKAAIGLAFIPSEYGGLGGNCFDLYRTCEELARIDLGICTSVFATFLGVDPLFTGGTEEQKKKWLGKLCGTGCLVAYGATEAAAGSDLLHLKTKAERVMDGDKITGYKLNGGKMWISNGGVAGFYTILARAPKGVSWFVVDKGTPGLTAAKHEDKHGIRLSDTVPLHLKDVFVPLDQLIGEVEGKGLRQAQAIFGYTRLLVAAMAMGVGWRALEHAIRYGQQRQVAGNFLWTKQGFTHKLVIPFVARLEACRAFIEETANRLDSSSEGLQTEGAIAKLLASETANKAADNAIQAFGGNGYVREFPVEKLKRDVKITCIYEGTTEILELTTFRQRWQDNINAEGRFYDNIAEEMDSLHAQSPEVGAASAAAGLRALSQVLKVCYDRKLTNNQIAHMKLGELMAYAETSAAFCRAAAKDKLSEAVVFDHGAWRAMSRVHAAHAAGWIASEGLELAAGCSAEDSGVLAAAIDFKAVAKGHQGRVADMDLIATKLAEVFHEEPPRA